MSLSFNCTACGKQYRNVKDALAGKRVRCSCGHTMRAANQETDEARPKTLLDYDYNDLDQILSSPDSEASPIPEVATRYGNEYRGEEFWPPTDLNQHQPSAEGDLGPGQPTLSSSAPVPSRAGRVHPLPTAHDPHSRRLKFAARLAGFAGLVAIVYGIVFGYICLGAFNNTHSNWWFATVMEPGPLVSTDVQESSMYLRPLEIINGIVLLVAAGMIVAGSCQLLNAVVFSLKHTRFIRWADELCAGMMIAFVALAVCTVFLNSNYYTQTKDTARKLVGEQTLAHQQSQQAGGHPVAPPVPTSSLLDFESDVDAKSARLTRLVMLSCAVPACVLLASMYRMFSY